MEMEELKKQHAEACKQSLVSGLPERQVRMSNTLKENKTLLCRQFEATYYENILRRFIRNIRLSLAWRTLRVHRKDNHNR